MSLLYSILQSQVSGDHFKIMRRLTLYSSTPINDTDVANKAYVDSKSSSDVSFLMKKEFAGEIVTNEGQRTAVGDVATLTASAGKDMYLATAKISGYEATSGDTKVELKINGTVIETFFQNGVHSFDYQFRNIGQKVAAGEIIKIEWITEGSGGLVEGYIECVEVDTGVDPTL